MKISKQAMADIHALTVALATEQSVVEAAIEEFNNAMVDPRAALETAVADYNTQLAALREHIEQLRDDLQSEFDDKSENWQNGDRGQAAQEWIDSIEEAMAPLDGDIEVTHPDEVAVPDFPDCSDVEMLSSQPEDA